MALLIKENHVPSYCNTGAQNTETDMRCLIDWVAFTFKEAFSPERIFYLPEQYDKPNKADRLISDHEKPRVKAQKFSVFDLLGISKTEFVEHERGLHGYRKMITCGHITVLYDGGANMGVHIQFSGQGCREYETMHMQDTGMDWPEFFGMVLQYGGSFTRIDLAIDDFRGVIQVADLVEKSKNGECRSKFKSAKYMEKIKLGDGSSGGITIYFGSSTSRIKVRIYEKLQQMQGEEKEVDQGIESWNRTEVECKDERAQEVAIGISGRIRDLGNITRGILAQYVNFVDYDPTDSNKGRWPVSLFWSEFLQEADKLKLTTEKPERSIKTVSSWFVKQVEPTLGVMFLTKGMDWIMERIDSGMEKLTKKINEDQVELKAIYENMIMSHNRQIELEAETEKNGRFLALANDEMLIRKGIKKTTKKVVDEN